MGLKNIQYITYGEYLRRCKRMVWDRRMFRLRQEYLTRNIGKLREIKDYEMFAYFDEKTKSDFLLIETPYNSTVNIY